MKKTVCMTAVALLVFAGLLAAQDTAKTEEMTLAKVIEMSKAGLGDETIINTIISSGATFNLTVQDVLNLKKEGVSENVINFMLRTRPLESTPAQQGTEPSVAAEPEEPGEALPAYVAEAGSRNYYDGYEYTDGYDYENERETTIIYHYYGPWFRAYPYYFGFYYYPAGYYYYNYWPDDYYYYFYYPRYSMWRSYYYYPHWNGHYYSRGGRYIKSPGGRIVTRYRDDDAVRYAVPRDGSRSRITTSSGATRGKVSTSPSRIAAPDRSRSDSSRIYSGSRVAVPRSGSPSVGSRPNSSGSSRNYSAPSSRSGSSRSYSAPSSRSRGSSPSVSKPRSSSSSRSESSSSRSSSSSSSRSSGSSSGSARSRH